jgi:hypothetical protein
VNDLLLQRRLLPLRAVLVHCLDEDQKPIPNAFASGFIRRETDRCYLYTCWHVVTGYNRNELKVGNQLPNRAFLAVHLQDARSPTAFATIIGGMQSVVLPLYDPSSSPKRPRWLQDETHIPHPDLNAINLFVPFWHDAIKIALPEGLRVSDSQIVDNEVLPATTVLVPGDKLYITGFPYGFSAGGQQQPTPVVLTRFAASAGIGGRNQEILLESAGAPGMSGGPVFVERDEVVYLFGLYTGLLYPDHVIARYDRVTALGTCSNMTLHWWGGIPFTQTPSQTAEI